MSTPPATAVYAAQTAAPPAPPPAPQAAPSEACPLCGAALAPGQEWCLRCGAAARTRLAPSPNWKTPVAAVAAVCALALGVLAASLVKLAGDSGPAPIPLTRTVIRPAAVAPVPVPTTAATTTVPAPGATTTTPPATPTTGSTPSSPTGGATGPTPTTGGATKPKQLTPAEEKRLHEIETKIG